MAQGKWVVEEGARRRGLGPHVQKSVQKPDRRQEGWGS